MRKKSALEMALAGLGAAALVATGIVLATSKSDLGEPTTTPSATRSSTPLPDTRKVITATDGLSQITIPGMWRDAPESWRDPDAVIHAGNDVRHEYVTVYTYDKATSGSFANLDRMLIEATQADPGVEFTERKKPITIAGLAALQYRFEREDEYTYWSNNWLVVINGEKAYYLLSGSVKLVNDGLMISVIDSFRELVDGSAA